MLASLTRLKQICNHPSHWLGDGAWHEGDSGKWARLRELAEVIAAKQEKVLVFTQFREMTAPLAGFLAEVFGREGLVLHGETAVAKRQQLVRDVATSAEAKPLDGITWREFEMLVGEAFRMEGYTVLETGGGGADGGVDLVLRKPGGTYLVQCKQWKTLVVPVTVVRELYGVMAHHKAAGGFVVTSGRFTEEAAAFAAGKNIRLVDGAKLVAQIRSRTAPAGSAKPLSAQAAATPDATSPACPICASTSAFCQMFQ